MTQPEFYGKMRDLCYACKDSMMEHISAWADRCENHPGHLADAFHSLSYVRRNFHDYTIPLRLYATPMRWDHILEAAFRLNAGQPLERVREMEAAGKFRLQYVPQKENELGAFAVYSIRDYKGYTTYSCASILGTEHDAKSSMFLGYEQFVESGDQEQLNHFVPRACGIPMGDWKRMGFQMIHRELANIMRANMQQNTAIGASYHMDMGDVKASVFAENPVWINARRYEPAAEKPTVQRPGI